MANTHSLALDKSIEQVAYILDGDQTGLDLAQDFTLEGWMKIEADAGDDQYTLCSKYNATNINYHLFYDNTFTIPRLMLVVSTDGSSLRSEYASVDIGRGYWYHLAVTRSKSPDEVKFFVNGEQVGATEALGGDYTLFTGTATFRIGARDSSPWHWMDGLVDEVRVWSDVRTPTEIADNYRQELAGSEAGLEGYWKLNDGYTDETSNGNDLTPYQAPTFDTDVPEWEVAADADPPVVANITPSPGEIPGTAYEARMTPVEFDIADPSGFTAIIITCQYGASDSKVIVFDGSDFVHPFDSATSVRTGVPTDYHFAVLPRGGWPGPFELFWYAIDSSGNLEGSLP